MAASPVDPNLHPKRPKFEDLQAIVDAMAASVTWCSRSLHYLWVSESYARWLGLTPEQIIGRRIVDVIGQLGFDALRPHFEQALRGERAEYEEKIAFTGVGERWIHATYTPTFGSDQVPDGWVAVVTDVDARRRAEDALREQNGLLLRLHEASALMVRENNLEGALQTTLEAVIGATHADFGTLQVVDEQTGALHIVTQRGFGPEFIEFFSSVDEDRGSCGAARITKQRVVVENVTADPIFAEPSISGVLRRAGVRAVQSTPLIGSSGNFLGMVSTHFRTRHRPQDAELLIVDLFARQAADLIENRRLQTEQKRAAEAIGLNARAKDDFLAMLSHELRNPLTPITLALDILANRGEAGSREIQIILRQVGHLTRLVDDLLDVERLTRGKVQLRLSHIELSKAIAEAVDATLPVIESKRHRLDLQVPTSGLLVHGDPDRLRQVFANLLNNAAHYTPVGGHIEVRADRVGSDVVIEMIDDGEGIEPELLPKIFEMFFQRPRAIDRSEGGLGLGLAVVKSLVEMHGGRVTAESEGAGNGSRFTVRLPLSVSRAELNGKLPAPLEIPSTGCLKILVVDDHPDTVDAISQALRMNGHMVEAVSDGLAALELLPVFSPDVALLDIGLPVMDGYEVAEHLARRMPESVPVMIALTGYGLPADFEKSRKARFLHHLVKPIYVEDLLQVLSSLQIRSS